MLMGTELSTSDSNYIAIRDDEGNYKVVMGRFVGLAPPPAEVLRIVQNDQLREKRRKVKETANG